MPAVAPAAGVAVVDRWHCGGAHGHTEPLAPTLGRRGQAAPWVVCPWGCRNLSPDLRHTEGNTGS